MKVLYKIDPNFIGKAHSDISGQIVLNEKLSQRVLKKLHEKGNKFIICEAK